MQPEVKSDTKALGKPEGTISTDTASFAGVTTQASQCFWDRDGDWFLFFSSADPSAVRWTVKNDVVSSLADDTALGGWGQQFLQAIWMLQTTSQLEEIVTGMIMQNIRWDIRCLVIVMPYAIS